MAIRNVVTGSITINYQLLEKAKFEKLKAMIDAVVSDMPIEKVVEKIDVRASFPYSCRATDDPGLEPYGR